jgi:hypothetical protein
MRVHCTNCGRDGHAKWQCTRPTKSTGRISDASINKDGTPRKNARYLVDCVFQICGKKFEAIPNEVKRGKAKTCSKSCAASMAERPDTSGENNPNWKGGISAGGKTARYNEKYPEKHAAHRMMTSAIRKGELVRGACEVCGEIKTDGHHDDYSKPLDVRWLCRKHHIEAHHGRFGALPVDTNNPSSRKGSGVESLRSSEPVVLNSANPQRLGRATRKDALLSAPNTNSSGAETGASPSSHGALDTTSAGTVGNKDRHTNLARSAHKGENPRHADGGKPLTQTRPAKFDKVAYMAKYMAKWRAEIKSGKRVPKRKGETT